ncbi:hypothetical protein Dda_8242 [Drechslerella dactyloides]|uniref:Uncharacterized protein n=1 Tax=Drechslerella dactyloides TaxID=74499 RepID=A0AAD6IRV9_DREDA|nr:hypothetical protein Dda_8242 [Drechslerella dactyloides]
MAASETLSTGSYAKQFVLSMPFHGSVYLQSHPAAGSSTASGCSDDDDGDVEGKERRRWRCDVERKWRKRSWNGFLNRSGGGTGKC